jgi:V/A-type H+/Na+-transporting ATPase subunit D
MPYIKDIRPTKSELISLKNRLRIAHRAYNILEMKREGLIIEITRRTPEVKREYDLLLITYRRVMHLLAPAYMIEGMLNLTIAAYSVESLTGIEITQNNLFGVRVPVISGTNVRTDLTERGYGLLGTSVIIDDLADAYEQLVEAIISYSGSLATLSRLLIEHDRIRRRVKALEHLVIPSMTDAITIISSAREELEREEQSRLFHIKKKRI